VSKVEVNDLKDNTYYATIHFVSQEKTFTMDSRPSDAIAIAVRLHAPIYVDDKVIQKSKIGEGISEALDKSEEGKKWAEYLEKLNPEDFGNYKI
jgi:bifunctional DNase/RNase